MPGSSNFRFDFPPHDGQVRERLLDTARTATPLGLEALHHQRLAEMRLADDKVVDIELMVVLRVRDRAFETFAYIRRDALSRKLEIGKRGRDLLAADELRDEVQLLRPTADHALHGLGFVIREGARTCGFSHVSLSSLIVAWLSCRRRGRGRYASARTRRICAPPSPRTHRPGYACGRCRRRRSGRRIAAAPSSAGSRS